MGVLKPCRVRLKPGTQEELLPDFDEDFPCRTDVYGLYPEDATPWHWHKGVELFYVESGSVEYFALSEQCVFGPGMGGMINANALHMTGCGSLPEPGVQHLHIFDPLLIAGAEGSRIEQKYILPLTASSQVEMIALHPGCAEHARALELLRRSFALDAEEDGYEIRLWALLAEIWLELLGIARPRLARAEKVSQASEQLKQMLVFIHENYGEKINVRTLARIAHVSERACYNLFRENLRMTPMEYVEKHRIRMACRMLAGAHESVAAVGAACGLGSRFGQVFRKHMGCTPLQHRKRCIRPEE